MPNVIVLLYNNYCTKQTCKSEVLGFMIKNVFVSVTFSACLSPFFFFFFFVTKPRLVITSY